jgi:hypothetical protein
MTGHLLRPPHLVAHRVGIDGLAVSIDVQTGDRFFSSILEVLFPQMGRPRAKGGSQHFGPLGFGKLTRDPVRCGNTHRLDVFLSTLPTRFRCSCAGHACDASHPEAETAASASVGGGNVRHWRAETGRLLAHTRRSLSLDRRANLSHGRLPAVTALRLLAERWFPLLPVFFPAWLAALLHPCMARMALR